jgi:hypothetical protein
MTLPGNATALLVLVAVLVALGYAAGRLHQWYRTDEERDEAYREGYDTATRSTFSLAARIIGPRRERSAARGSATVHAPASRPDPAAEPSSGTPFPAPAPSPARDAIARPLSRAAARSRRFHSIFRSSAVSPSPPNTSFRPITSRPAKPSAPSTTPPPAVSPAASPSSGVPGSPEGSRSPVAPSSPSAMSPPQHAVDDLVTTEPAPAAEEQARPSGSKPSRPGRHFVPDELVRAATYRLSPDRVARAKVPTTEVAPTDDGDPASRPPVPKPRSS